MNDAEFIERCQERGIKVFGCVFEVQGWEFPVELNEDESEVLSMNELRGVGKRGFLGLREFTQNTYPKLWKPFEHYFPDGLVNSDGEMVTDLLEECTSRDIYGEACHSTWVEVPGNEHYAYLMDRNNPVWREYLKAIIRIQIDAGVAGVHLDEADLPIFATGYGGCFCKDCMKLFRAYLQELPAERAARGARGHRPRDVPLRRVAARARGYDFKSDRESTPLYWDYIRFQRKTIVGYFAELADYIREYGRSKGRDVLVCGNYYYLSPHYYPFEPHADILVTEMNATSYRQPAWCRYAAGFARGKPVIVVENPYGGVGPELLPKLQAGKGYDLFRMMQYEASALGINMSVPYGAWMGSVIEDSFWAPHDINVEIQDFLAEHERLYTTETYSETPGRVQHPERVRLGGAAGLEGTVPVLGRRRGTGRAAAAVRRRRVPRGEAARGLDHRRGPHEVPNGRAPGLHVADARRRRRRSAATSSTAAASSRPASSAPTSTRRRDRRCSGTRTSCGRPRCSPPTSPAARRWSWSPASTSRSTSAASGDKEAAIHVIRYDYDEERDEVPVLDRMTLDVRVGRPFRTVSAISPLGEVAATLTFSRERREMHRIELEDVPLYTVILLQ